MRGELGGDAVVRRLPILQQWPLHERLPARIGLERQRKIATREPAKEKKIAIVVCLFEPPYGGVESAGKRVGIGCFAGSYATVGIEVLGDFGKPVQFRRVVFAPGNRHFAPKRAGAILALDSQEPAAQDLRGIVELACVGIGRADASKRKSIIRVERERSS